MFRRFNPGALLLLLGVLIALSGRAAIQLEGVVTYQVFPNRSSVSGGLEISEHFKMRAEGGKWWVETHRLVFPETSHPLPAWPISQQAGSDGQDIYYCKILDAGTNSHTVAWILPGNPPRTGESPTVSLLWLACCAGSVLTNQSEPKLQSLWTDDGLWSGPRVKSLLPVNFVRGDFAAGCLERIEFLNKDDKTDTQNGADAAGVYPPSWIQNYTNAVYRVESTTRLGDGPKFPASFTLERFSPVWGNPTRVPYLRMTSKLSAMVTNTAIVPTPEIWLPRLPEEQITVQDYRPKFYFGGTSPEPIVTTNGWPKIAPYRKSKLNL